MGTTQQTLNPLAHQKRRVEMNSITETGNVAAAPEKIEFQGKDGNAGLLVRFRLANNEWVNGKSVANGFFDVVVFGDQAKNILDSVQKGDRLVVTGYLQHQVYTKPDGTTGSTTKIISEEVGMSLKFQPVIFTRKERASRDDRNIAGLVAELDTTRKAAAREAAEALPPAEAVSVKTSTTLPKDILESLPAAKLQALYKEAGGDPAGLKKAELVLALSSPL